VRAVYAVKIQKISVLLSSSRMMAGKCNNNAFRRASTHFDFIMNVRKTAVHLHLPFEGLLCILSHPIEVIEKNLNCPS